MEKAAKEFIPEHNADAAPCVRENIILAAVSGGMGSSL
jgi:hypothetical protein